MSFASPSGPANLVHVAGHVLRAEVRQQPRVLAPALVHDRCGSPRGGAIGRPGCRSSGRRRTSPGGGCGSRAGCCGPTPRGSNPTMSNRLGQLRRQRRHARSVGWPIHRVRRGSSAASRCARSAWWPGAGRSPGTSVGRSAWSSPAARATSRIRSGRRTSTSGACRLVVGPTRSGPALWAEHAVTSEEHRDGHTPDDSV